MAGRWLQRWGAPTMLAALLMVIAAPMQSLAQVEVAVEAELYAVLKKLGHV
jgi:hypothetical protein